MKKLFLIVLMIGVIFLSGCVSNAPKCPECPEPSSYSDCNDQAMKTRTNYRCSESTNFECESHTEEKQCSTEISFSANGLEAVISPSVEKNVKGIVTIEARMVPVDTQLIAVALGGGDLPPLGAESKYMFASKTDGVWTIMIDTTKYSNGLYAVGVSAQKDGDSPPSAFATTQILISN